MATKVDLRERALRTISWLSEGQTPGAYETALTDRVIDECQAFLESEGVAYWDANDIPEGAMFGLVDYVAGRVARRLMSVDEAAAYSSLVEIAEERLREFSGRRVFAPESDKQDVAQQAARVLGVVRGGQPMTSDQQSTLYAVIDGQHEELEALGLAYWSLTDIPEGAKGGLRDIVAAKAALQMVSTEKAALLAPLREVGLRALRGFAAQAAGAGAVRSESF